MTSSDSAVYILELDLLNDTKAKLTSVYKSKEDLHVTKCLFDKEMKKIFMLDSNSYNLLEFPITK